MNELDLFDKKPRRINLWEEEWVGMPEFVQKKKDCYAKIIVRFDNEQDLQKFASIVEQNLSKKTKSIWYPKLTKTSYSEKFYTNEP